MIIITQQKLYKPNVFESIFCGPNTYFLIFKVSVVSPTEAYKIHCIGTQNLVYRLKLY